MSFEKLGRSTILDLSEHQDHEDHSLVAQRLSSALLRRRLKVRIFPREPAKQRHLVQPAEHITSGRRWDRGSSPRVAAQLVLEALVSGVDETLASGSALCGRLRKRTCLRVKGHEGTGLLHHWELV